MIKKVVIESLPVNQDEKEEIDPNDLSKFSSEFGLIGKNIYIPKLKHSPTGAVSAESIDKLKYKTSEDYPHIE